jgi:NADH-quinone oxidoreductase subunit N
MALFLLSMIGIPPTAGFVGKYYLFAAALSSGMPVLAVIGVLNSVISLGYYSRVLVALFMTSEVYPGVTASRGAGVNLVVAVCAVLVLWFGCLVSAPFSAFQNALAQSLGPKSFIASLY